MNVEFKSADITFVGFLCLNLFELKLVQAFSFFIQIPEGVYWNFIKNDWLNYISIKNSIKIKAHSTLTKMDKPWNCLKCFHGFNEKRSLIRHSTHCKGPSKGHKPCPYCFAYFKDLPQHVRRCKCKKLSKDELMKMLREKVKVLHQLQKQTVKLETLKAEVVHLHEHYLDQINDLKIRHEKELTKYQKSKTSKPKIDKNQYVYLIQLREFVRIGESVYKIGMTQTGISKRIKTYPNGSAVLLNLKVCNSSELEKQIIKDFKIMYNQRKNYGREYFEGDSVSMINHIIKLAKKQKKKYEELKIESSIETSDEKSEESNQENFDEFESESEKSESENSNEEDVETSDLSE